MKIDISNLKTTILILKKNIRIWNLIFDPENCYFNCLKHYLNLIFFDLDMIFSILIQKCLFDLKFDIWILN
jgi:hypothetical protein